jgi:hypothetical protein
MDLMKATKAVNCFCDSISFIMYNSNHQVENPRARSVNSERGGGCAAGINAPCKPAGKDKPPAAFDAHRHAKQRAPSLNSGESGGGGIGRRFAPDRERNLYATVPAREPNHETSGPKSN